MRNAFMLIPILVIAVTVIGIVVATLGVRGRPVLALPRCRTCDYDLRNMAFMSDEIGNCPECGTSLAGLDGVSFGRWQRRPKMIVLGVVLLALPWLAMVPMTLLASRVPATAVVGPPAVSAMTTPALLATLPRSMNSPWEWQELERRMTAGTLTTADVDAAFAALAAGLNADRAAGKPRQPPHWYGNFVAAVMNGNAASRGAVDALCQAYYGQVPPMTMRKLARVGEPMPVVLNVHEPWNLTGVQRVWAISSISAADASKLTARDRYNRNEPFPPDALSGSGRDGEFHASLVHALPPGEHEITFHYEVGIVPDSVTLVGIDGRPGTPEKWPATLARWTTAVKRKVTVVGKDQPLVTLVTDPARDPFRSSTITVEQALARPSSRGVELVVKWKVAGEPSPVAAYHVYLLAPGIAERIDYGTIVVGKMRDGSINSYTPRRVIELLQPDVKRIDVLLTPDPTVAEQHIGLEEIWGQPLELKGVALERFDVGGK